MGQILSCYIMPHPPVMIPEIGQGREYEIADTLKSADKIVRKIEQEKPDTVIISSPHAPCFRDFFCFPKNRWLYGDFSAFGRPDLSFELENNLPLTENIISQAERSGLNSGFPDRNLRDRNHFYEKLDHGVLVPIYFLKKISVKFKLIVVSTPLTNLNELFKFGGCIFDAVTASNEKIVYIASGDLSHGLTAEAPAGYCPEGASYDQKIKTIVETGDIQKLLSISETEMEAAAECGTRSFAIMYGLLENVAGRPEIYSYQAPFGVGYLTAGIQIEGKKESDHVHLAREAIEAWIEKERKIPVPEWIPDKFYKMRAGTFVSLKQNGHLRGCIGTISPACNNLAEEIMTNARHAASEDPRFPPLSIKDLENLEISVDVLSEPEPVINPEQLDVKRYGVIVSCGFRRGLLLPDLEGIDTPHQQIAIALQKAGITASEDYNIERFEVRRYH